MTAAPSAFTKGTDFLRTHKLGLFAGAAGIGGGAYGVHRGSVDSSGAPGMERAETMAHHGLGVGLVAAGVGGAAFAGRGMLKSMVAGGGKGAAGWYGRGMMASFKEKTFANAFGHRPMALTVGALVGGALGGVFGEDGTGVAKGAAIGMAAGVLAYPMARNIASDWSALGRLSFRGKDFPGRLAKTGVLAGAAVGVGLAARAYMHQPEYESDDIAIRDGLGGSGYESAPSGLRTRLAAMGGTGDVVLGLHNGRH